VASHRSQNDQKAQKGKTQQAGSGFGQGVALLIQDGCFHLLTDDFRIQVTALEAMPESSGKVILIFYL